MPVARKEKRGLKAFSSMILSILQKEKAMEYTKVAETIIYMTGEPSEDKNIRRRVYDALNVLCAVDVIRKEKKMVYLMDNQMCSCESEINKRITRLGHIITSSNRVKERIEEKKRILEETIKRKELLLKLINRNKQNKEIDEKERLHLPFLLISTGKKSRIDCETNDKRSYFRFTFANEYKIYEDAHILKQIFQETEIEKITHELENMPMKNHIDTTEIDDAWNTKEVPVIEEPPSNYIFAEDEDWVNLYNFLN
ncbi:transcription factor Dp-1 [Nematocida sp. AWRm80]|nr:transcription factor Dp-1 [Nematocida sp. AWRm80]